MQTRSSSSDDRNVEPANKDAAVTEKEKLLREIQELKCIIKQCEWNLQTLRFKDVERHTIKRPLQSSDVFSHLGKMPNVEVDLQNDMYRFAGLHCVRARRDEYVFNFTSTNGEQEDNTQAVQIFIKDGKANLGKWVMPMSIDMNYILSKTPIDEIKNIKSFVKSCKHNVDCYIVRQEQFLSLKKRISNMKHCTLQSDLGFKQISLELYGVHDNENDTYMNLIIHLLYHFDKARPSKIEIDRNKGKLSDDTKQRLKISLKKFKVLDLQTAFDEILTEDSTFTWTREDDSESPLELNNTSSSDEEDFLTQLQSIRKRSLRKRQKKRELQKKWNERKRQRDNNIGPSKDNSSLEEDSSKAKVSRTENPRTLRKEKKAEKAPSNLKQKKINKNLVEETTPLHKPKVKLKQTKLNFQSRLNETTNSNTNEVSSSESKLHRPENKQSKIVELITSTPLRVTLQRLPLSPSLEINNITSIEMTKKTANKLDDSKNSDQLSSQNTQAEHSRNRLRNRTKKITSSSQVSKPYQRLTRSMKKN